jgi:hypothetical protein
MKFVVWEEWTVPFRSTPCFQLLLNVTIFLKRVFGFYGGKGLIAHPSPNS